MGLRRGLGLLALLTSLLVAASAQQTKKYTVKEGDSLYTIAHRFGLRLPDLLKVNRLSNPHKLKPGDVIRVPVKGGAVARKGTQSASQRQLARRNPSRAAVKLELAGEPAGARRVLAIAHRYMGRPYRYGGSSSRGFDCSGFVLHVYRQVGVQLPHHSGAQARVGKPVSRQQLQPGDLVFFRTRGSRISHVGIYIGNGKFIHASSARGRVRIDSLDDGYYKRRYAGARRITR
jgi:cell wall-associated NlpC family hydrolase